MENKKPKGDSLVKKILGKNETVLFLLIVILCAVLSSANDGFLTSANFLSMTRSFAIEGIALIGMTMLLIMGVWDMSIGSIMVLASYFFTVGVSEWKLPMLVAMLIALVSGIIVGAINGVLITRLNVNAYIATLSTMSIFRGLVYALSQGAPKRCVEKAFSSLSLASIGKIPVMFICVIILFVLFDIALRKVRWFRQLYFIGGNPNSAELTGINVRGMRLIIYIATGFLAALAGCLLSSRLQGSVPTGNANTAMTLMVACVIGGCSFAGGRGTMLGAVLGHAFLKILNNGLIMLGISDAWFNGVLGIFLIVVVFINTLSATSVERNKAKRVRAETLALMNSEG